MHTVDDINTYLRENVDDMLDRPGMYGTQLAVEAQILQALQLIGRIALPDAAEVQFYKMFRGVVAQVLSDNLGTSKRPAASHSLNMFDFVRVMEKVRDALYKAFEEGLPSEDEEE